MVGTRASNVHARPGKPDMPHPRRSSKQVDNEEEAARLDKEAKSTEKAKKLAKLAKLEIDMQEKEAAKRKLRSERSNKAPSTEVANTTSADAAKGKVRRS